MTGVVEAEISCGDYSIFTLTSYIWHSVVTVRQVLLVNRRCHIGPTIRLRRHLRLSLGGNVAHCFRHYMYV